MFLGCSRALPELVCFALSGQGGWRISGAGWCGVDCGFYAHGVDAKEWLKGGYYFSVPSKPPTSLFFICLNVFLWCGLVGD